ncbi:MAG: hypothetical protein QOI12_1142 [Alphaproteobacteria bacterium]|jgi:hypothetical protein|nr:hypothetical protein [Alphaproteobacteria bacterium]
MDKIQKTLILLFVAAIPAAAPPFFASAPELCFTSGSLTYQLSASAAAPNYTVRIDNQAAAPDFRVQVVDRAELADFALVDDVTLAPGGGCKTAGLIRTVKIVAGKSIADLTVSLAREPTGADLALYVHSARVTHQDAAALFAVMRHVQTMPKIATRR